MKRPRLLIKVHAIALVAMFSATANAQAPARPAAIEQGRHLVQIGHCNNCHTPGYTTSSGKVPEDQWLTGNPVGWRSRKGTIYAPNLRLFAQNVSEEAWIHVMRTVEWRPPMPWWSMREHTDEELRAMYQYIRSLKPLGSPAPSFLPPDQVPAGPYQQLPDMSLPNR